MPLDEDSIPCTVCGEPVLWGSRHPTCGRRVMAVEDRTMADQKAIACIGCATVFDAYSFGTAFPVCCPQCGEAGSEPPHVVGRSGSWWHDRNVRFAAHQTAIAALEAAREFVKTRHHPEHGHACACLTAHDNINRGISALAVLEDTERLCWTLRQLVRMVPAGESPLCWVRFTVGAQEFTIGSEPMPEDEAAHFAGLFVFALAGAVRMLGTPGVQASAPSTSDGERAA